MPSNAMKISHLIQQLEGLRGFHGDLDVIFASEGNIVAVDGRNVNVAGDLLGQKLPQPALVIGLWRDEQGRLRNSPGAAYVATADDGLWNYDRTAMPDNEDVRVWKRYGGEDIGKRVGDKYFVREGADEWQRRPVEIVPAGILGWRPL
mgnify:FL=1